MKIRWLLGWAVLFALAGCTNPTDSKTPETTVSDTILPEIPSGPTGIGIWGMLRPQETASTGLLLAISTPEGPESIWIERSAGKAAQLVRKNDILPIPLNAGWAYLIRAKEEHSEDCSDPVLNKYFLQGTTTAFAYGLGKTVQEARQHAKHKAKQWAEQYIATCETEIQLEEQLLSVLPTAVCFRRNLNIIGETGKNNTCFYALDPARQDTIELSDHFSQMVVQTASGLVARDLGQQWTGDPIPLKPSQLDLLLRHRAGQYEAIATYAQTFETAPIIGEGNLGEIPKSLTPKPFLPVDWQELSEAFPGIADVYFSPDENLVALIYTREIWLVNPLTGLTELKIPKNGDVIQAEWANGEQFEAWSQALRNAR